MPSLKATCRSDLFPGSVCADANPRLAAHIQELYDDGVFTLQGKEYPCLDKTKAFSCGKA